MPTIMPEGIRVPTGSDSYDLTADLRKMMASAQTIVPVTNLAARTALVAGLVADGRPPSAADPLYVDRADAPAGASLERTIDGTTWTIFPSSSPWVVIGDPNWKAVAPSLAPAVRFEGDQVVMRAGRLNWRSGSAAVNGGVPFTPVTDIPAAYRPATSEWAGSAVFLAATTPNVCAVTVAGAQVLVTTAASGTMGDTIASSVIIPSMRWARQ